MVAGISVTATEGSKLIDAALAWFSPNAEGNFPHKAGVAQMGLAQSSCGGEKLFENGLFLDYGHATMQGHRDTHEDDYVISPCIDGNRNAAVFSIFDGHYGRRAAKYAAKNLHRVLSEHEEFARGDFKRALSECFLDLDRKLLLKSRKNGWQDGTTALTAVIVDSAADDYPWLVVANAGDCRAIVFKTDDTVEQITVDHSPSLKGEKKRIVNAGGMVRYGRIEDRLAVSRGFGDRPFKEPRALVSAKPDVFRVALRPTEAKFIVLACDGIWNWLSNEQVGKFVNRQLNEGKNSREVSKGLIKLAFAQGSTDNITAMVINLRHCESRSAAMTPSETVMKLADSEPARRRRSPSPATPSATDPDSATTTAVSSRKTKSRSQDSTETGTNVPSPARKGTAKSEPTKRRSNQ